MKKKPEVPKLTKEQRHSVYLIMLAESENPSFHFYPKRGEKCSSIENGLCFMFKVLFGENWFYHNRPTCSKKYE